MLAALVDGRGRGRSGSFSLVKPGFFQVEIDYATFRKRSERAWSWSSTIAATDIDLRSTGGLDQFITDT